MQEPKVQKKKAQSVTTKQSQGEDSEETEIEQTTAYLRKRKTGKPVKEEEPKARKPTIDEMVEGIKLTGILGVVGRRYELSNDDDKRKLEEAVVYSLHKFKKTPTEIHGSVPAELHEIIEGR